MAPTGEYYGTFHENMSVPGNQIVEHGFDDSAPTGEGSLVKTADGRQYRVVPWDAPNVIRRGRVEPR